MLEKISTSAIQLSYLQLELFRPKSIADDLRFRIPTQSGNAKRALHSIAGAGRLKRVYIM
jgi:hypothetical protein